jgi:hypothetical protein
MPYSGILYRVVFVRTDVSEECIASIVRVTRISELGTTLAITSNRRTLRRGTWGNIPEDGILHCHRRDNFKSYIICNTFRLENNKILL